MRQKYRIDKVTLRPSLEKFDSDFRKEIEIAKVFSENMANKYLETLDKEVHAAFVGQFTLAKRGGIAIHVLLSTVAEYFVHLYPAERNELIVECVEYPVQLALFGGLIDKKMATLAVPYQEAIETYLSTAALFNLTNNARYMAFRGKYRVTFPKIWSFSGDSYVILCQSDIELLIPQGKTLKYHNEGIAVLTGDIEAVLTQKNATEIASWLVKVEIGDLVTSSEFFRESLAHPKLEPIAKGIQQKLSRSKLDPSFSYPVWQLKLDVNELKKEARSFNIDVSYVEELLKTPSLKPHDGTFLWYYTDPKEFMLQWTLINAVLLIVILLMWFFKYDDEPVLKKLAGVFGYTPSALLVAVNAWIFIAQRPSVVGLIYWIIPGIIFLIALVLSVLFQKW